MMMNGWTMTMVVMKVRFREGGSCCRWFWLAMSMRASSQHESASSGDEVWSMPAHCDKFLWG